jgi:methionine-rich copper-binding protein CopC
MAMRTRTKLRTRNRNVVGISETLEARRLLAVLQPGDANQDYFFDEADLVLAFQAAKYGTGAPASWEEGDWDGAPGGEAGAPPAGNGEFDSGDFVRAFVTGIYRQGAYDSAGTEPRHDRTALLSGDNASVVLDYDVTTGALIVHSSSPLSTLHLRSESGLFTPEGASWIETPFDVAVPNDLFLIRTILPVPGDLGAVLPAGLSGDLLLDDLSISGSFVAGGGLGEVGLVCDCGLTTPTALTPYASGAELMGVFSEALTAETREQTHVIQAAAGDQLALRLAVVPGEETSLEASLEVRAADQSLLASATTSAAGLLAIEQLEIPADGEYTIRVAALGDTTGTYQLDVYRNASLEDEYASGRVSDTLASAQPLEDSMLSRPLGIETSLIVGTLREATEPAVLGTADFEEGVIPAGWSVSSSNADGSVIVTNALSAAGGSFALIMDSAVPAPAEILPVVNIFYDPLTGSLSVDVPDDTFLTTLEMISESQIFTGDDPPPGMFDDSDFDVDSDRKLFKLGPAGFQDLEIPNVAVTGLSLPELEQDLRIDGTYLQGGRINVNLLLAPIGDIVNEATWTITDPDVEKLSFWHAEWNDDQTDLPARFFGSVPGDGVSISVDGQTWYRAMMPPDQAAGEWVQYQVDLTALAAQHDISFESGLQIKFQQSGKQRIPNGGRGYDGIQVLGALDRDWYSIAPDAGEPIAFAATRAGGGEPLQLGLYRADGTLVATSQQSALNESVIQYRPSDAEPLSVRVGGDPGEYRLFSIVNAQYEMESNNTLSSAQPIPSGSNLVGHYIPQQPENFGYVEDAATANVSVVDLDGNPLPFSIVPAGLDGEWSHLSVIRVDGGMARTPYFMHVDQTVPDSLMLRSVPPIPATSTYVIESLYPLDPSSVQVEDLQIDGIPAIGVTVEGNRATFTLPILSEGLYPITIAAGSLRDVLGRVNPAVQDQHVADRTPPTVVRTSPLPNETIGLGPLTIELQFSEDITIGDAADMALTLVDGQQRLPTEVRYDEATFTLELDYLIDVEAIHTLRLQPSAGKFADQSGLLLDGDGNGIPGGMFRLSFVGDVGDVNIQDRFQPIGPLMSGAMLAEQISYSLSAGDTDRLLVPLEAGQTLSVSYQQSGPVNGTLLIRSPDGQVMAQTDLLTTSDSLGTRAPIGGTYAIEVSNLRNSVVSFEMDVAVNASFKHTDVSDDDSQRATSLDDRMVSLGTGSVQQATVLATPPARGPIVDWYSVELQDHETLSLTLSSTDTNIWRIAVYDGSGELVAQSGLGSSVTLQSIPDVTSDGAAERYTIRVTADSLRSLEYVLVATKNAAHPGRVFIEDRFMVQPGLNLVYDANTGQIDVVSDTPLSTLELRSNAGHFVGARDAYPGQGMQSYYRPPFDVYNGSRSFKLVPSGFASPDPLVNYANIGPGWSISDVEADLVIDGSVLPRGSVRDLEGGIHIVAKDAVRDADAGDDLTVAGSRVDYLAAGGTDVMNIELLAGAAVTLETATFFNAVGIADTLLDPVIELLDPAGNRVAIDDNSAADGRNAQLVYTPAEDGVYTIRVTGGNTNGAYVISTTGQDPDPGMKVIENSPLDGIVLDMAPRRIQVVFNHAIDRSSLQAEDFLLDGMPLSNYEVLEGHIVTLEMNVPFRAGEHEFRIPAEAIQALAGHASEEFTATFTIDADPLVVTEFSLLAGTTLYGLPERIEVEFSRAIDASSITASDLVIGNLPAIRMQRLSGTRYQFFTDPRADVGEGDYQVSLAAQVVAAQDFVGNDAYESSFTIRRTSFDINGDGSVTIADLDLLCDEVRQHGFLYDANQDQQWNQEDFWFIQQQQFNTRPGDMNQDGVFDSSDLVRFLELGHYESGASGHRWSQGDFDCDGVISTGDLIAAFQFGGYQDEAPAPAALAARSVDLAFADEFTGPRRGRSFVA